MDTLIDPKFLVTLILTIIGYVVWQVRLESKIAANTKAIERIEREQKEWLKDFEAHRLNGDIHFNLRTGRQVEQKIENRFRVIEQQLSETKK